MPSAYNFTEADIAIARVHNTTIYYELLAIAIYLVHAWKSI